jgi:capsular exopolysaccharide synthesis family protein
MYQSSAPPAEAATLEDYLRAIRLRKWLVLALALLGLIGAFLFATSRTPTYTATATVLLRPTPVAAPNPGQDERPNLEREREVMLSDGVADDVIQSLGIQASPEAIRTNLDVEFRPLSDVLTVHYTSNNPDAAATTANAFAQQYTQNREGLALEYFRTIIESLEDDISVITAELDSAQALLTQLRAERATALRNDSNVVDLDAAISIASTDVSNLTTQLRNSESTLRNTRQKLNSRLPAAEVLRPATTPGAADGIALPIVLAGGLILGLLFGVVSAFLLERLDTTARDEEDVALALGTSVIGSIPTLGIGHRGGAGSLIMLSSGGSNRFAAAREAFRRLRSSVQFLNSSSGVSSIIVTSSTPGEGKSLTAANISIALAQNGSRVVLVSADLRRPTLERMFGMEAARPGLSDYLAQAAELNAEKVPGIDNLWLIRSGTPPENPGELLNSDRFEQMVKELEREDVEYIVVDTPPVLNTADAVSAARYVDGVIVVVDTERTDTADLLQVRADLERSGSKLLGAVMNRQQHDRGGRFRRDRYAYYRSGNGR